MWAKLFVKLFTWSFFFFKEEPYYVNNAMKSSAHIVRFEFYCQYYVLFYKSRYIF